MKMVWNAETSAYEMSLSSRDFGLIIAALSLAWIRRREATEYIELRDAMYQAMDKAQIRRD